MKPPWPPEDFEVEPVEEGLLLVLLEEAPGPSEELEAPGTGSLHPDKLSD